MDVSSARICQATFKPFHGSRDCGPDRGRLHICGNGFAKVEERDQTLELKLQASRNTDDNFDDGLQFGELYSRNAENVLITGYLVRGTHFQCVVEEERQPR
jgi:hypothetical protein